MDRKALLEVINNLKPQTADDVFAKAMETDPTKTGQIQAIQKDVTLTPEQKQSKLDELLGQVVEPTTITGSY